MKFHPVSGIAAWLQAMVRDKYARGCAELRTVHESLICRFIASISAAHISRIIVLQ